MCAAFAALPAASEGSVYCTAGTPIAVRAGFKFDRNSVTWTSLIRTPAVNASVNVAADNPAAARTAFTAVRSSVKCTALITVDPATIGSVAVVGSAPMLLTVMV